MNNSLLDTMQQMRLHSDLLPHGSPQDGRTAGLSEVLQVRFDPIPRSLGHVHLKNEVDDVGNHHHPTGRASRQPQTTAFPTPSQLTAGKTPEVLRAFGMPRTGTRPAGTGPRSDDTMKQTP